jgi:hypothetical protein
MLGPVVAVIDNGMIEFIPLSLSAYVESVRGTFLQKVEE